MSGLIDPDEFRIHKRDATLLSARIGSTGQRPPAVATLSASQLAALGALVTRMTLGGPISRDRLWFFGTLRFHRRAPHRLRTVS